MVPQREVPEEPKLGEGTADRRSGVGGIKTAMRVHGQSTPHESTRVVWRDDLCAVIGFLFAIAFIVPAGVVDYRLRIHRRGMGYPGSHRRFARLARLVTAAKGERRPRRLLPLNKREAIPTSSDANERLRFSFPLPLLRSAPLHYGAVPSPGSSAAHFPPGDHSCGQSWSAG